MAQKCVHKACGKTFTDPNEECIYHPGPPVFHEGQKGWKCCKPRVLTFDEFLAIPPCTTGKHSTVDDTPAPEPKPKPSADEHTSAAQPPRIASSEPDGGVVRKPIAPSAWPTPSPSPAPPEEESDDPSLPIPIGRTCRRRGCNASYLPEVNRDDEQCVHHPGQALFHEGSKGWTCCKRRVLEFDEFMKIEGCQTKRRHLFVGKGKKGGEENLESVRHDFYQTPTSVIASLYLKKIDKAASSVTISSTTSIDLYLRTSDNKRFKQQIPLYGPIDTEKSSFKILGTKIEFNLVKTDYTSWPVLRSDEKATGEIIQTGRPGMV